jgi:N-acetylgalactosamine 4-sulfate 6-O-sulfotransferase
MYPVFMADWLRIWPKEQMLFLRNEDYGKDMEGTLDKVFEFLGLGKMFL